MSDSSSVRFIYNAKKGGVFCDAKKIAPWPSFSWRRMALFDILKLVPELNNHKGKEFIEVGFGSGVLTYDFYKMGFTCTGYDYGEKAVEVANQIFNSGDRIIDFRNTLDDSDTEKYDCLGAFEVLEHIDDDSAALQQWRSLLKPDGYLLLTIPAKMKYWDYSDLRAGHVRRYEKEQIISLLSQNGFDVVKIACWGFPMKNCLRHLFNLVVHKPTYKKMQSLDDDKKTQASGIERSQEFKFKRFLPFRLIQMFGKIQRPFYNLDWGTGYAVIAKKINKGEAV
jgi:SAM-dependent methyltransferase